MLRLALLLIFTSVVSVLVPVSAQAQSEEVTEEELEAAADATAEEDVATDEEAAEEPDEVVAVDKVVLELGPDGEAQWSDVAVAEAGKVCLRFVNGGKSVFESTYGDDAKITFAYQYPGSPAQQVPPARELPVSLFVESVEKCLEAPAGAAGIAFSLWAKTAAGDLSRLTSNDLSLGGASIAEYNDAYSDFEEDFSSEVMRVAYQWAKLHQQEVETGHLRTEEARPGSNGKAKAKLYFYPDGRPITPLPMDLAERDDIELWLLLPRPVLWEGTPNATDTDPQYRAFSIEFTACPSRDLARVRTDWGVYSSESQTSAPEVKLTVDDIEPTFVSEVPCGAGQTSFSIETAYGENTHTLQLQAVYWASIGVQFTFDTTLSGDITLVTDTDGSQTIQRSSDQLGLAVVPVFVWHPFGLNAYRPSLLGALVGPTEGIDMSDTNGSFFVGDTLCGYGLCVAVGTHVRRVEDLYPSSGLAIGSVYDGTEDELSTRQVWVPMGDESAADVGRMGLYFGVTLDSTTIAKLFSAVE